MNLVERFFAEITTKRIRRGRDALDVLGEGDGAKLRLVGALK